MIITFFTTSLRKGGAERVISTLCNDYFVKFYTVRLITCNLEALEYPLNSKIEHMYLDDSECTLNKAKGIRFLKRKSALKKYFSHNTSDVLISFLPEADYIVLSIKKYLSFPVIVSIRSDPSQLFKFVPYYFLMKILYPRTDGIVFQTKEAMDYFCPNIIESSKAQIILNPINNDAIRLTYKGQRKKEIVTAGRLIKAKNHKLLIQAFCKIEKKFPDYILIIYGEGCMRDDLEKLISSLNLTKRIFLPGVKDNLYDYIYKSSLFVLSSDYEGLPNALMEAMALGLPVISTDCPCGGSRELIENRENGILVSVNNIDILAKAMEEVLQNCQLSQKISMKSNLIASKYNLDNIGEKWIVFIRFVLTTFKERESRQT